MDINYFDRLWRESKTDAAATAAFWDSRAGEFNALHNDQENQRRLEQLLSFWRTKEMISPRSEVLDIGCGPGYISFDLAPLVKKVEGFDLSPQMIAFAQKKQIENGANNTSFRVLDWAQADLNALGWNKKFDFVFAARCPGINSRESLEKMSQASKGFCFISGFAQMKSSLRDELNKIIKGSNEPFSPAGDAIYCAFNILWLMGLYPEISFYDTGWQKEYDFEQAYSINSKYYEMHGGLSDLQNDGLLDYLKRKAENGPIEDHVKVKVAWLHWRV